MLPLRPRDLLWLFAARHQQTTMMARLANPLQQIAIALIARAIMARILARLQDRLGVVQHNQGAPVTQRLHHLADAPLHADRPVLSGLTGQKGQRVIDYFSERRRIAQRAPEYA